MEKANHPGCPFKTIEEQENRAKEFGFYWESLQQLIDQIQSECKEVEKAWEANDLPHLQEEIGDLMNATVSLAVFCRFDPKETLRKSHEKFQERYDALVRLATEDGHENLKGKPMETLMAYWNLAKKANTP